jgi:hypothetical protein
MYCMQLINCLVYDELTKPNFRFIKLGKLLANELDQFLVP